MSLKCFETSTTQRNLTLIAFLIFLGITYTIVLSKYNLYCNGLLIIYLTFFFFYVNVKRIVFVMIIDEQL